MATLTAVQSLGLEDLELLREEDLPSMAGLVMLPHPLIAVTLGGGLADIRALTWHTPAQIRYVRTPTSGIETHSAVRISVTTTPTARFNRTPSSCWPPRRGGWGTPLPPLPLDATGRMPFGVEVTPEQTTALRDFSQPARQTGDAERAASNAQGMNEERVIGEYVSGTRIDDTDDTFARRFLYAFWRLCEQRIAAVDDAHVGPTARLKAERAGAPAEVRIVRLRAGDAPVRIRFLTVEQVVEDDQAFQEVAAEPIDLLDGQQVAVADVGQRVQQVGPVVGNELAADLFLEDLQQMGSRAAVNCTLTPVYRRGATPCRCTGRAWRPCRDP